jgi:xanthine dehydrogenase accessory factor
VDHAPIQGPRRHASGYDAVVDLNGLKVVVRGVGDIGSAVAHRLFRERCAVVIHDEPKPTTTRRGMAFADAAFDGCATLDGVDAFRARDVTRVCELIASRRAMPLYTRPLGSLLKEFAPAVLVDARMRKHSVRQVQRGLADLTIGLGPDLVVGRHADMVIETSWDGLGRVITKGASLALAGEPREIDGHARDRYVYALSDGVFRTKARIGDEVRQGQEVAEIGFSVLTAPLDGVLRGLTRDGVTVTTRTKVIEVDPRGAGAEVRGIGERPRRIADGVVTAIREWDHRPQR